MITLEVLFVIATIGCATASLTNMFISTSFPEDMHNEASPYINKAYIFLILTHLLLVIGFLTDNLK